MLKKKKEQDERGNSKNPMMVSAAQSFQGEFFPHFSENLNI